MHINKLESTGRERRNRLNESADSVTHQNRTRRAIFQRNKKHVASQKAVEIKTENNKNSQRRNPETPKKVTLRKQ